MSKTTVVNKHHKLTYDIYVGRGSKWGNPFSHMEDTKAQFKASTRDESVESYREWIKTQPELMNSLHELKGKILCCYCKPQSCHGDILAELADAPEKETDMHKIIEYINGHEIDDMVAALMSSDKDINKVLKDIAMSRVEYQGKSQELQWALQKAMEENENG